MCMHQAHLYVPTTPFTPDANTVLLTCQGKTFQDHSTNNHSIARSGDVHIRV